MMAREPAPSKTAAQSDEIVDVWSRTSRRHRVRAVLMLLLLGILFAGLCCFTLWLRSGHYLPWEYEGYIALLLRSFQPSGTEQITLSSFLSAPIPVQEVPIHAVIMGLQFASLVSIPILVAILYRLPVSVLFAAMVFFLAAMPWLAITVLIGCALASTQMFRFSFRYASALIGLIPIAIYFGMASWEPSGSSSPMMPHQALLYAPWVLALLGSCVICAVALATARLINYRPGGIPPILVMLFAIPVLLFHKQVGRDELEYRILAQNFGPGSRSVFASSDVGVLAKGTARRVWSETEGRSYDDIFRRALEAAERGVELRTERDRREAAEHCDVFIERFAASRYIPNVLFIKGRALDLRLDGSKLLSRHRAEYRSNLPSRTSLVTWQTLLERFPDNELSATALFNLAMLDAGDGDLAGAVGKLEQLVERFDVQRAATRRAGSDDAKATSVFQRTSAASQLGINLSALVVRADRLREMLLACRADKPRPVSMLFGPRADGSDVLVNPVQILVRLDDASPRYRANLEGIARAFADSESAGYVEVRLALMEPAISRRIQRLTHAAETLAGRPAGAEALFRKAQALREDSLIDEAKAAFETLVKAYPQSCWSTEAKEHLTSLSILQETPD